MMMKERVVNDLCRGRVAMGNIEGEWGFGVSWNFSFFIPMVSINLLLSWLFSRIFLSPVL
jgi:hypothetical protein